MTGEQTTDPAYEVCYCGDYRWQHDNRGCQICRGMPTPWSPGCPKFRLEQDDRAPSRLRALYLEKFT